MSKARAVAPQGAGAARAAHGQVIAPTSPFGNLRFGNGGRSSNSGITATVSVHMASLAGISSTNLANVDREFMCPFVDARWSRGI